MYNKASTVGLLCLIETVNQLNHSAAYSCIFSTTNNGRNYKVDNKTETTGNVKKRFSNI